MITISRKEECCGCSACVNICHRQALRMERDSEGFLYPKTDASLCNNCGLCQQVCPVLNRAKQTEDKLQKAYLVQHRDKRILAESTSGGAFTPIAEYVIAHGGVVFGVTFNEQFKVVHVSAQDNAELAQFRNSKYVQSDPSDTFRQVKAFLQKGRLVCFSGTPCQIHGLKNYLMKDYENLILVDVVCRAVPSPGVWEKYFLWENEKSKITSVRFRDKTLGYQYSTMEIKTKTGQIRRGGIESQPWLRMFFSGMIIRPSCTECRFRNSETRVSDFTIWDCFNIYKLDKRFPEDSGTTRMLVHTRKGLHLLKEIRKQIHLQEISYADAVAGVKELTESPVFHEKRAEFFRDFAVMDMGQLLECYFPETWKVRLKKNARLALNKCGLDKLLKHILGKG
ncbi:MAG: Coenzyme F420 hydrogenase/dehydrogenase, beta subunit C-terminal domain [Oscillospiraceae bacterium]|nr:Coenzyme F420 hydrogenase/dehydrogenase, beta subunit C-terminal domain [Oscillospiraceae bacterium]